MIRRHVALFVVAGGLLCGACVPGCSNVGSSNGQFKGRKPKQHPGRSIPSAQSDPYLSTLVSRILIGGLLLAPPR